MTAHVQNTAGPATLLPATAVVPQMKTLWWPLSSHDGSSTPSGYAEQTGITSSTRTEPMTAVVSSGSVNWPASGGFSVPGTAGFIARLQWVPGSDDEEIYAAYLFDLAQYAVGQTLLIAFDVELPSGWTASQGGDSREFLWIGDANVSGWGLETSSGLNLRMHYRAPGSTAVTSTTPLGSAVLTFSDGRWRVVAQIECTAPNTFRGRSCATKDGAAPALSPWSNLGSLVSDGTAAPGVAAGTGLWLCAKNVGGVQDRPLRAGAIIRDVWFAGSDAALSDGVVLRATQQMLLQPANLPDVIRLYRSDDPGQFDQSPDGNADETFGDILLSDMFIALNGKRDVLDHPEFSVQLEPNAHKKNIALPTLSQWSVDANNQGTLRIAASPGGWKFRRTSESPASGAYPAFMFSTYRTDQSNSGRCECSWHVGPNIIIPRGENIWLAFLMYIGFDVDPTGGWVTIMQLYHQAYGAGLNPPMDIAWRGEYLSINYRTSQKEYLVQADQIVRSTKLYGKTAELKGTWFDLVVKAKIHWDPAVDGYATAYINGEQVDHYAGPIGYKGPTSNSLTPIEVLKFGAYPGSFTAWSPDVVRDVYVRRAFVAKDVQGYSLAQIRAALQA